ncbi:MAG: Lrp/AsnC family transcriptional regulator [Chloroflexota bacterium]
MQTKVDEVDRKILGLLVENGRISFAEIGRQVGLSLPAAADRVRRLEDTGLIEGYQAKINLKKLGFPITVFVELTIPPSFYQHAKQQIEATPEILEAHHVAGELSLILKLRLADLEDLEPILAKLNQPGQSKSIVVLSTFVEKDGVSLLNKVKKIE